MTSAPPPTGDEAAAAYRPQQNVYPQQYAYPPQAYVAPPPTNVLAVITLVLALVGISIGAVITGHISLSQLGKTGEQGRGIALAGLIIGYVGCAFWVLFWLATIAFPLPWLGMFASVTASDPSF
jgi:hypothetical protein